MSQVRVTLPDGMVLEMTEGSTIFDVASAIGPGLGKAAVAGQIDGVISSLSTTVLDGCSVRILTDRDDESLDVLRHSAAHVLATAVREIKPDAGIGFGPAIEDGFYYDFEVEQPFTPEDLATLEEKMVKVVQEDHDFVCKVVTKEEAQELFADDHLKLERLEEFTDEEIITVFQNGPFLDLCRGPHIGSTGQLKHFKLLSAAGAYWRGDEKRQMLQRIYGTAFFSKKQLQIHLDNLEEAKKRDHRVLGKELDLFSTDSRVGSGLILWHPKGAIIRQEIQKFEQELLSKHGYDQVFTPHVMNERIFEISGHLENFEQGMFGPIEVEGSYYRPKPMNCPGHIAIYQSQQRSYRDLPVRMAEFGTCYRYERSGVLHGMLRVRGFTQDDAHIFCTREQAGQEIIGLLDLVDEMLQAFGYPYSVEVATKPKEKALGSDEDWEVALEILTSSLEQRGVDFEFDHGGGAFYGPKLDFKLIDAIGRKWQGPTVQLDFNLPERFELEYVGEDNEKHRPVMLHRVLVGSMERFVGGLIEHYAGAFPLWLAPEQIRILPVSEDLNEAAVKLGEELRNKGVRTQVVRRETLSYRIRDAEMSKVPFMAVIGKNEEESDTVTLRRRGTGKKQEVMKRVELIELLLKEIETKSLT
ncbi:MAG: threonine--tRNA ligase [Gemmatimonadetes bacterium]|nr:threonine--tRNA ligase [Gemmatimonadota bacterium]